MKSSNSSQGNPQFGDRKADTNASEVQPNHSVNSTATQSSGLSTTSMQEPEMEQISSTNTVTKALPTIPPESPYPVPASPKHPRKRILLGVLGVGAIALTIVGIRWWQYAATHQETDDAYVTSHIHPVNSRISGTVTQVLVDDNQIVSQGALLVQLDPRDYEVALPQAKASLEAARHQAEVAQTNIGVASSTSRT